MKIIKSKKKFIYLISPNKIKSNFYSDLKKVLALNKTNFFQLRLKNTSLKKQIIIGRKIKKICKFYKVKFLINDNPNVVKKINADGCHLGQKDMKLYDSRDLIGNKIVGVTCHNSIKLVKKAIKNNADYIALGAFNFSKTKKVKYRASIDTLKKVKRITNLPIVAIGGINDQNYKKLLLNKANFLAISSYIFNNKNFKPNEALKLLR